MKNKKHFLIAHNVSLLSDVFGAEIITDVERDKINLVLECTKWRRKKLPKKRQGHRQRLLKERSVRDHLIVAMRYLLLDAELKSSNGFFLRVAELNLKVVKRLLKESDIVQRKLEQDSVDLFTELVEGRNE
jgi:hypothetical protein